MKNAEIEIVRQFFVQIINGDFNADIPEDLTMALKAQWAFETVVKSLDENRHKKLIGIIGGEFIYDNVVDPPLIQAQHE